MIKLKKNKKKKAEERAEAAAAEADAGESKAGEGVSVFGVGRGKRARGRKGKKGKKMTPGQLRIQKDLADLDGGTIATCSFPDPSNLTSFKVNIKPDSGFWEGAAYQFGFEIPPMYPHEPPKVSCETKIYHPNIDLKGKVCLNILRAEWKPVLDVNAVIYGLITLFAEPNPDDPLEREIADIFRRDVSRFESNVRRTLKGATMTINGVSESFPRLI